MVSRSNQLELSLGTVLLGGACAVSGRSLGLGCGFDGRRGEVGVVDSVGGTLKNAFAAGNALLIVDVGQVVGDGDGLHGTHLGAFATADTGVGTTLHGDGALLLVDAGDEDAAIHAAFVAQLNDAAWTRFGTGATGGALFLVDHRDAIGAHMYGVKLACSHTVATAETPEGTSALAGVDSIFECAGAQAIIVGTTIVADDDRSGVSGNNPAVGGIAAHHSHLGFALFHGTAEQLSYLGGDSIAAWGTAKTFEVALSDAGFGESAAAGLSAAAAVGSGEHLGDLVNQRVFNHLELLCHVVEHNGKEGTDDAEYHYRNEDLLSHLL